MPVQSQDSPLGAFLKALGKKRHSSFACVENGVDAALKAERLLPLTPALSLGERENRSLSFPKSKHCGYSRAHGKSRSGNCCSLSQGRGQGEGKRWSLSAQTCEC